MFVSRGSTIFVFQDKVIKELNFILANQDIIQNQITQLEDAIKQMEVKYRVSDMWLVFVLWCEPFFQIFIFTLDSIGAALYNLISPKTL